MLESHPQYTDALTTVHSAFTADTAGNFLRVLPLPGLIPIGNSQEGHAAFKLTFFYEPDGLFIKAFSPSCAEYALAYAATMVNLAQLPLRFPVLPMVAFHQGLLAFPMGEELLKLPYHKLPEEERDLLEATILQGNLEPLHRSDKVLILSIGDDRYLADVIDDTEASIGDFKEALMKRS